MMAPLLKFVGVPLCLLCTLGCGQTSEQASLRDLRSDDSAVRAKALEQIGPAQKDAVPTLLETLADERTSAPVRERIVRALARMGPEAREAVPFLIAELKKEKSDVRAACYALKQIDPSIIPTTVVPVLSAMLQDKDQHGRQRVAVEALGDLGSQANAAVPELVQLMLRGNHRTSLLDGLGIVYVLRKIDPKEAVENLADALRDKDANVRDRAASDLTLLATDVDAAVPALIEALNDTDQYYVCSALAKASSQAKRATVPRLIQLREIRALGALGPDAKAAVPMLIEELTEQRIDATADMPKYRKTVRRTAAAVALGDIGPDAKAAVPGLIEALKEKTDILKENTDEEYETLGLRVTAATALGAIGAEARAAVSALTIELKAALERNLSLYAFQARNQHFYPLPRVTCEALGRIGSDAKPAVPVLIEALKYRQDYDQTCTAAARALGEIGPSSNEAVLALLEVWNKPNSERDAPEVALEAIGRIGPEAKAAVPGLIEFLKRHRDDPAVRGRGVHEKVVETLGRIGPGAKEAVFILVEILPKGSHDYINESTLQAKVARALGDIGPDASDALPALQAVLQLLESALAREVENMLTEQMMREKFEPVFFEELQNGRKKTAEELSEAIEAIGAALKKIDPKSKR